MKSIVSTNAPAAPRRMHSRPRRLRSAAKITTAGAPETAPHVEDDEPAPEITAKDISSAVFVARLGAITLALRKSAALTQEQLADNAGLNVTTIQRLEQGEHECTIGTLRAVERGLGVKPGLIMRMSK